MTDSGGDDSRTREDADDPRRGGREGPDGPAGEADHGPAPDDDGGGAVDDAVEADDDGVDAPGDRRGPDRPPSPRSRADVPAPTENPLGWYLRTEHPLVLASRDVLTSVVLVAMVGVALFAVSGVWPPLVAIESGSMEPHMSQGDLVIVVEEDRFDSQLADEHGIVTQFAGEPGGHDQFGAAGNVIVFRPDGSDRTPIIHRAAFYVEEGEDWTAEADPRYLRGLDCADLADDVCPAPWDGYVTRGDANGAYDQIDGQSTVVRPSWIEGRAVARVPYLGCIRLELADGPGCWDGGRRAVG